MAIEVIMPKLGLTMTEGTVINWFKKEGEVVKVGEPLFSVETDKVAIDVEAEASATLLKIVIPAGQTVPITTIIAYLGQPGEKLPEPPAPAAPVQSQSALAQSPSYLQSQIRASDGSAPLKISPLARRLARENQIDLHGVKGSGPQGRIVEADINKLIQDRTAGSSIDGTEGVPFERHFLNQIKRVIAKRMSESAQNIPHFYLNLEIDCSQLMTARKKLMLEVERDFNAHLTYTDFLLHALAQALGQNPIFNSSWVEGEIRVYKEIHLGLAISTAQGLVVAVLHDCGKKTLPEIAAAREALTSRARDGKLTADDIANGTFTLTNLGMFAIDSFQPIINPPQCGILAVGAMQERPYVENGQLVIKPTMTLTLAADHRVVDGVEGAMFLKQISENLNKIK